MTIQIIIYKCEECGDTHPDINSAKICEAGHKQRFHSPRDFYRNRDMAGRPLKSNAKPKTTKRAAAKPQKKKGTKKA